MIVVFIFCDRINAAKMQSMCFLREINFTKSLWNSFHEKIT